MRSSFHCFDDGSIAGAGASACPSLRSSRILICPGTRPSTLSHHVCQTRWTSSEKNRTSKGHFEKYGDRSSRWRLDSFSVRELRGRPGFRLTLPVLDEVFVRVVANEMRSSCEIWRVRWLLCHAHSNCRADILDVKPETMQVISHGRRLSRPVRTAPPLTRPLCWLRRRSGFGVEPT